MEKVKIRCEPEVRARSLLQELGKGEVAPVAFSNTLTMLPAQLQRQHMGACHSEDVKTCPALEQ